MSMSWSALLGLAVLSCRSLPGGAVRKEVSLAEQEEVPGVATLGGVAFGPKDAPEDMVKGFKAASFEDLARVYAPEMGKCFSPQVVHAVLRDFADKYVPVSKISQENWDLVMPTAVAIDAVCKAGEGLCESGKVTYKGFLQLKLAEKFKHWRFTWTGLSHMFGDKEVRDMLEGAGYVSQAQLDSLTKAYKSSSAAGEGARSGGRSPMENLEIFIELDQKPRDGKLTPRELTGLLDTADPEGALEAYAFSNRATVQAGDLTCLPPGLPKVLAKSIMATVGTDAIKKTQWEEFSLQTVIADFIGRDMRGKTTIHDSVKKTQKMEGTLKFYQVADALPDLIGKLDAGRNAMVEINGEEVAIHVPTIQEITGRTYYTEKRSLSAQDLEKWLTKKGNMSNGNRWVGKITNKWSNAHKLASNAIWWASASDGSGVHTDEWEQVMGGRLAVFLRLDQDHDGKLTFQEAYPFLRESHSPAPTATPQAPTVPELSSGSLNDAPPTPANPLTEPHGRQLPRSHGGHMETESESD